MLRYAKECGRWMDGRMDGRRVRSADDNPIGKNVWGVVQRRSVVMVVSSGGDDVRCSVG